MPDLDPASKSRPFDVPLQLWGGIECTRNRVGDAYFDQLDRGGHANRPDDIARVAALGITAVRYPVLWERVAPSGPVAADWSWTDERLGLLQAHGLEPVVGFVHHGSGPADTSLLDWGFVDRLAEFGEAFAARYPHVRLFTPVNEPLTTARFSALYGHWYPHARDGESFVRALLVQCAAVAETMRRVRRSRPDAQLLQTEDAGRIFGTAVLRDQVRFENQRRWLTFDLLSGRVTPRHPLWRHLRENGASADHLRAFVESPCPPDLLGLNYYVTSDRALDHEWWRHPDWQRGGNGRQVYADVEAVRCGVKAASSHRRVLREAWARYRRPLVFAEVHLAGHRDEQLRWLAQAWRACSDARARGIDVRALTVWSLFGAFGWDRLVTAPLETYECGAFDVRGAGAVEPRPTAIAQAMADLATTGAIRHPAPSGTGWWEPPSVAPRAAGQDGRPVLLIGGRGTLGTAFRHGCEARRLTLLAPGREALEATDPVALAHVIREARPWLVVNAAGFCDVDGAELDVPRCRHANLEIPRVLAQVCAAAAIPLVTFSTDLVFDGRARTPYVEHAVPSPLNAYGAAKADAERIVRQAHPGSLIVRTSAFFGPWDAHNFAIRLLDSVRAGREVRLPSDVVVSATYVPDLVDTVLDLAIDGATGTWHLVSSEGLSWHELGRAVAERAGVGSGGLVATPASRMAWRARRPAFSALTSARANLMPGLDTGLDRFLEAVRHASSHDDPDARGGVAA